MHMHVLPLLLLSLQLAHAQGPWVQLPSSKEVAAVHYEVANSLIYSGSQTLLLLGCDALLQRVFDLTKLVAPSNITVACRVSDRCPSTRDVAAKLQIARVSCGMEALTQHHAVIFAQFSACDNPACIKAKQDAEQLSERVFMVWDSHGPHVRLEMTMRLPRTVEFHEKGVPTKDVFSRIYSSKFWGNAGGGSGIGSEPSSTAVLRPKLVDVIKKYGIKSMLDAPCGSLAWMPLVLEQVPDMTYTGIDVACDVIAQHQVNYANRTNWRFYCADVCHQGLPRADIVFSRDSLQHLPLSYAHAFLRNVRESGARYLLVGSYINGTTANIDVPIGGYYHINVLNQPFSLQHALLETLSEEVGYSNDSPKSMMLLEVAKM